MRISKLLQGPAPFIQPIDDTSQQFEENILDSILVQILRPVTCVLRDIDTDGI